MNNDQIILEKLLQELTDNFRSIIYNDKNMELLTDRQQAALKQAYNSIWDIQIEEEKEDDE